MAKPPHTGSEMGVFYLICWLRNYPQDRGTRPLFASMTVMRRVGHQEINRVTRAQITQVMQRALSRFVPRGEMRAPGTRSLLMVAMIRHELGGGEAVDVGHPLGGGWYVSSR